jgi:uncharacterized cupin superfamily protein
MIVRKGTVSAAPDREGRTPGELESLPYSDAGGLTQYGVYVESLRPGARSSERHWHEREDELLFVLAGEVTIVEDDGEHTLGPGDAACWRAGTPNAHHAVNRSQDPCSYLIVGTRVSHDVCHYPDARRVLYTDGDSWRLVADDGTVIKSSAPRTDLRPASKELSQIRVEVLVPESRDARRSRVVVVRCEGTYGHGSGGNSDAVFLESQIAAARCLHEPSAMVLDFRELSYVWGDLMSRVIESAFVRGIECALVVSEVCREGLESLFREEMGRDPARFVFDDPGSAIARVEGNLAEESDAWELVHATDVAARLDASPHLRERTVRAALSAINVSADVLEALYLAQAHAMGQDEAQPIDVLAVGRALLRAAGSASLGAFERGLAVAGIDATHASLLSLSKLEIESLRAACYERRKQGRPAERAEALLRIEV